MNKSKIKFASMEFDRIGKTLVKGNHLFEKVWGKDPYKQVEAVYSKGLGNMNYRIECID